MLRFISHLMILAFLPAFVFSLSSVAQAQPGEAKKAEWRKALAKAEEEYQIYFKKPRTPLQFWTAIDFEVETGRYDVAGVHLKQLLFQPKDKITEELLKIEEIKGLSHFLRLRSVPKWFDNKELNNEAKKNAENLIELLTEGLEKKLSDPARIKKYIKNLSANTEEVRAYAFAQLKRSRDRAAPYLVDTLRDLAGKVEAERLKRIILLLGNDAISPCAEILKAVGPADYEDVDLRLSILQLFNQSNNKRAIPYLWHMSESTKYPPLIRSEAKKTLAKLLGTDTGHLPDARAELTRLAKDYAQHRMEYADVVRATPKKGEPLPADFKVKLWPWDGKMLGHWNAKEKKREPQLIPSLQADYSFATRHLKEALDLDPAYKPAQVVMLNMLLEKKFGDHLNQFIGKPMPKQYHDLLATLDTDVLIDVLEQAMNERNVSVVLPLVRILGERGESQAARTTSIGMARGLVRALYYPDRRVQREAIHAILQLPGRQSSVVTARIVEILRRFLKTPDQPQLLAIDVPEGERMEVRKNIIAAGWQPVFVSANKDIFAAVHDSVAIDAILIHPSYPRYELPYLLSNLRKDSDAGQTPVLVLAPANRLANLKLLAVRHPNIVPALAGIVTMPTVLKTQIQEATLLAKVPKYVVDLPRSDRQRVVDHLRKAQGTEFTSQERKQLTGEALDLFWQMAGGKIKDYNIRPAKGAILDATRFKDVKMAQKAVETYAHFPGTDVQQHLAGIMLDGSRDKQLRLSAAKGLTAHINKYGLFLNRFQIEDVRQAFLDPQTDAALRRQLALVVGTIPQSKRQTGLQLKDFQP